MADREIRRIRHWWRSTSAIDMKRWRTSGRVNLTPDPQWQGSAIVHGGHGCFPIFVSFAAPTLARRRRLSAEQRDFSHELATCPHFRPGRESRPALRRRRGRVQTHQKRLAGLDGRRARLLGRYQQGLHNGCDRQPSDRRRGGVGAGVAVRIIGKSPDRVMEFGESRTVLPTVGIDPTLAGGNDHRGRSDSDGRRIVQDHRRIDGRCARAVLACDAVKV